MVNNSGTNICNTQIGKFIAAKSSSETLGQFFKEFSQSFADETLGGLIKNLGEVITNIKNNFSTKINGTYGSGTEVSPESKEVAKKLTNTSNIPSRTKIMEALVRRLCVLTNVRGMVNNASSIQSSNSSNLNKAIEAILKYLGKYEKNLETRFTNLLKSGLGPRLRNYLKKKGVRGVNEMSNNDVIKALNSLSPITGNANRGSTSRSENEEKKQLILEQYRKLLNVIRSGINKGNLQLQNNKQKKTLDNFTAKRNNPTENNLQKLTNFRQILLGRPVIYLIINKLKKQNQRPNYIINQVKRFPGIKTFNLKANTVPNAQIVGSRYINEVLSREGNAVAMRNIFFTGPSGSGKTTLFESYVTKRDNKYGKNREIIAFLPKFSYDYNNGTLVMSDEIKPMRLKEFQDNHIKPTLLNPSSSRAHMCVKIDNDLVFDLAGSENPIKMMVDTLGFNIFEEVFWNFKTELSFSGLLKNNKRLAYFSFLCLGLNPYVVKQKDPTYYVKDDSLDSLIFVILYWSFIRLDVNKENFPEPAKKLVDDFKKLFVYPSMLKKGQKLTAIRPLKNNMFNMESITYATPHYKVPLLKEAVPISSINKIENKARALYNAIRRCFEGFYIMRSLYSLRTIFQNYKNYNNMVAHNTNNKNKIVVNSKNTGTNVRLELVKTKSTNTTNSGSKTTQTIVGTNTLRQMLSGSGNKLFTIKNKLVYDKHKKYPTVFLDTLLKRKGAKNIMFGVVQGDLNQTKNNISEFKKAQVVNTINYLKFLQS